MKYYDESEMGETRQALETAILAWDDVSAKKMFGCPSYRAAGTMFAVLVTGALVVTRLPQEILESVPADLDDGPFEAGGRTMKGWRRLAVDSVEKLTEALPFVRLSYEMALTESDDA